MRALLFCSLILTACTLGTSTNGDSGKAKFEYGSCLFGCEVGQAMMTGTAETIRVTASSIPPVTARSTDESVLAVGDATRECCAPNASCRTVTSNTACNEGESVTLDVPVVAKGTGSAELVLDQDGTPFDSVMMKVAAPASLVLSCGNPGSIALHVGDLCGLSWVARDSSGDALMATTGVTVTTSDVTVASLSTGLLSSNESTITATQQLFFSSAVTARASGTATISANAGGATSQVVVSVTP